MDDGVPTGSPNHEGETAAGERWAAAVAELVRNERIGRLEQASDEEILGVSTTGTPVVEGGK